MTHEDLEKDVISKEDFEKFSDVGTAFTALQTKMTLLLRKADHSIIRRVCIAQAKAPGGVHLSEELKARLTMTQNVDSLLDTLTSSDYWSWIDVRLLETIVMASESSQAIDLLTNYKSAIFSKKLIDILPYFPGKQLKKNTTPN